MAAAAASRERGNGDRSRRGARSGVAPAPRRAPPHRGRGGIERVLAPLGRRVDELSPMVDARLSDGSRVNVVIPPLSVDGPAVSIRRFSVERPGPDELVELGTLTEAMRDLLQIAVVERRAILVSGGTGSGKTTMLNALSRFVAPADRVITIE